MAGSVAASMYGDGGGTLGHSGHELRHVKRRNGKGKMTMTDKLKLMQDMCFGSMITRMQYVSDFTKTAIGGSLGLSYSGTSGPPSYQWMPSYMFNLSTLGSGYQGVAGTLVDSSVQCGYRQKCTITTGPPAGTSWTWESISGANSTPSGTGNASQYQIEKYNPPAARGDGTKLSVDRYVHDWSDIKLMIFGAQQVQTRVHYALVKFREASTGPLRIYNTTTYDGTLDAITQNDVDTFWVDFWARKSRNPLITSGMPTRKEIYTVLHHESITVDPKTTIDKDIYPNMCMVEHYFHPHTKFHTGDSATVDLQSGNITGLGYLTAGARKGYWSDTSSSSATYNYGLFPDYRANVFLFVWADNPLQNTTSQANANVIDTNYDPSFDLVIRNKYSFASYN